MSLLEYFTDPILRAPTVGSILMCIFASLMGVILLLQRRLLVGESISHAAYPGAILGMIVLGQLAPQLEHFSFFASVLGAWLSSFLGMVLLSRLEKRHKIHSDAALCLIIALFFGIGILFASFLQASMPLWASQAHILLFGQAATLRDEHIWLYAILTFGCVAFLTVAFRPIQALLFDRGFSASIGFRARWIERTLFLLLLFSLIIGIRSVGVILMSGMLIAPAIAARQWSNRLKSIFWLSAIFGASSGFFGNLLSVESAIRFGISLPSGPAIILIGAGFAIVSLLFAPKRGLASRLMRLAAFRIRCLEENILKEMWKKGEMERTCLKRRYPTMLRTLLRRLKSQGWMLEERGKYFLSADGQKRAGRIVRLHRLWELYLTEQLGLNVKQVHVHAEEMEHILTPDLEKKLTELLANPKNDPHAQPIPELRSEL